MRYFVDGNILTLGPGSLLWAHTDQSHFLLSESAGFDMWVLVVAPEVLRPAHLFPPRLGATQGYVAGVRQLDHQALGELSSVAASLRASADLELLHVGLRWWTARAWLVWRDASPSGTRQLHPAVRRAVEALRLQTETPLAAFVPHDLRRTGRTTLGRLDLSPFIGERVINQY